jgi:hypothetical protein
MYLVDVSRVIWPVIASRLAHHKTKRSVQYWMISILD